MAAARRLAITRGRFIIASPVSATGGPRGRRRRLSRAWIGRGRPAHQAVHGLLARELRIGAHPGDEGGLGGLEARRRAGETEDGGSVGRDLPVILAGPGHEATAVSDGSRAESVAALAGAGLC